MTNPGPFTPENVPPDTDRAVYRWVTKLRNDGSVVSELTRIEIRQP